ncbi:MAG: hypothetical protein HKL79_05870 [Thermoplasmata archaeon]|nr:hypothetical protein [Thermoplasmata archaeon]
MRGRTSFLSEEAEQEEREGRDRLEAIDGKLRVLHQRRQDLVDQVRALAAEQKALYESQHGPQAAAEQRYEEHRQMGREIARLRDARNAARAKLDELTARAREIRSEIPASERARPEQVRKEIADLELRQQTHALPVKEENALIARMRERSQFLKELEAHAAVLAEHEKRLKEAETAMREARGEVSRLGTETVRMKGDRDAKLDEVRSNLAAQGSVVAQMRAKGLLRRQIMEKLDSVNREFATLDREAMQLVEKSRQRREEARDAARRFAPQRRGAGPEEIRARVAESTLEQLKKHGRVTLR